MDKVNEWREKEKDRVHEEILEHNQDSIDGDWGGYIVMDPGDDADAFPNLCTFCIFHNDNIYSCSTTKEPLLTIDEGDFITEKCPDFMLDEVSFDDAAVTGVVMGEYSVETARAVFGILYKEGDGTVKGNEPPPLFDTKNISDVPGTEILALPGNQSFPSSVVIDADDDTVKPTVSKSVTLFKSTILTRRGRGPSTLAEREEDV